MSQKEKHCSFLRHRDAISQNRRYVLSNDAPCAEQLCVALWFACKERSNSGCASITGTQDHVQRSGTLKISESAFVDGQHQRRCCCV